MADAVDRLNKDSYQIIAVDNLRFVFIGLEYDMPQYTLDWAQGVIDAQMAIDPNTEFVLVSHNFLNSSGDRPTSTIYRSDGRSAEYVWQNLIDDNCQIHLVLNGHYPGEAQRTDLNSCGEPVHQLLADYQSRTGGGDGWLRYMTFRPADNEVDVFTYSPTTNGGAGAYETDTDSQFTLAFDLTDVGAPFEELGTVLDVASGATASYQWDGLDFSTEYEWYAVADDGAASTPSSTWTFTTSDPVDPTVFVGGTPLAPFAGEPGVASGEQSYSVSGSNLTEDIVVTAPTDFEVSLSSTTGFGASVTLTESGGSVASTPVFVRMNAASEGTPSGDITHVSAGATTVNVAVSGSVVAIPDEWVAYNDMNTLGGAANPTNVTEFEYSESGSLVDYVSGVDVAGDGDRFDDRTSWPDIDDGGPVSNAASDAYAAFDGIADLTGTDQLQSGESATLTFTGLDPSETYAVTLSANRDNPLYDGNRYAQVTIDGVDASTPASSAASWSTPTRRCRSRSVTTRRTGMSPGG